jgi:putative lipoprotein
MLRIFGSLVLAGMLLSAQQVTVSGTAAYRERMALPAGAKLVVEIMQGPTLVSSQTVEPTGQVPIAFSITYEAAKLVATPQPTLHVRLEVPGLAGWIARPTPLTPRQPATGLRLMMMRSPQSAAVSPAPAIANPLEGTSWKLTDIGGKPASPGVTTTLQFKEGRVAGKGGCNSYSGPVTFERLDGPLSDIKFGNLAATMMACMGTGMEQEQQFFQHLGKIAKWKREGKELVLFTAENVANLRFVQE